MGLVIAKSFVTADTAEVQQSHDQALTAVSTVITDLKQLIVQQHETVQWSDCKVCQ